MKKTALVLITACFLSPTLEGQWLEWGGPGRDFTVQPERPLEAWSDLGPKVLWLRTFEPGYSGLVAHEGRLFTMTRQGADEAIVALAQSDGAEIWRHSYTAPTDKLMYVDMSYGDAPQATPLFAEGKVFGFGFTGVLTTVDARSGEKVWSRDLTREYHTRIPYFGHSASPIRVGDTVVVLAGGAHAFDLHTGELRWENREFEASYASPILVQTAAGEQLVAAVAGEVVGLSPEDGRLLWRHEHANKHKTFLSTPVVGADGTLFASAYFLGSIGLRLGADGKPTELWETADLQVSQSNAVSQDNMVVASHNRNLMAVDMPSGEILWREKGVGRSNLVRVGENALLLDDRGRLTLARWSRQGFERLSKTDLLTGRSWTAPTVIGSRLFVRNGAEVLAVDLATSARTAEETAAGLRGQTVRKSVEAPPAFTAAVAAVEAAARRADSAALKEALTTLAPFEQQSELAPYALYARGFAAWHLSLWGPNDEQLQQVDQGVEALKRALELKTDFAEAHALLSPLYSSYYRLHSPRAGVIGQLGDEHLAAALEQDAENPRVMTLQAFDFLNSPPRYGGDPARGREVLAEAIRRFDAEKHADTTPGPRWGSAMARTLLAQSLLGDGRSDEDTAAAGKLLEEALHSKPDDAFARQLLANLSGE